MKIERFRHRRIDAKPVFIGISFMLHAASALVFFSLRGSLPLPSSWSIQFGVLVAVSWMLNFLLIASRNVIIQIVLLSTRILAFILAGFPLGSDIAVETILLIASLIDFSLFAREGLGLLFSLLLLAAAVASQHPVLAWDVKMPAPGRTDVLVLAITGAVVFLLLRAFLLMGKKHRDAQERAGHLEHTVEQLTTANLGFQKYALAVGNASIIEERSRFSREIHDTIGYTLTNLIIMIEACQDLMKQDPESLKRMLVRAGVLAQDGLADTRRALHALRKLGVDDVRGIPAIRKLIDTFQNATGVEVVIEYGNIPWNMNEDVERTLFRFIQEGMINSFKHGKATRIIISLWQDDRHLIIVLQDNGRGSEVIKEGIGISGMRERVERFGGEISSRNISDGFELSARIPVEKTGKEEG